jgi:N-acetylmuramoyl-L-alanine amidase
VAPTRKQDPGEKFPWQTLHISGVGHWVPPAPIIEGGMLFALGDQGEQVTVVQRALADYGYGIDVNGRYDNQTHDVVAAFQRHFRQARVDGVTDASTIETLKAVIRGRDKVVA